MPQREVQSRRRALGWSQNALARKIGRESGFVSKVIRRQITSGPTWAAIRRVFSEAEDATPTAADSSNGNSAA